MASSPIIAEDAATGTALTSSTPYPVAAGFGVLCGSADGAVPRDIILEGLMEGWNLTGKHASLVMRTKPAVTIVASGVINAGVATPTRIIFESGIDEVEFTKISFRRFIGASAEEVSPVDMAGRLYAAPPVNGVWSEAAAIMPETNLGGLGKLRGRRVEPYEELRHPAALWYRPLVTGSATMNFEISVWGMPRFRTNMAKPFVPVPYVDGTEETPPE